MSGIRLCPPASTLASSPYLLSSLAASSTEEALTYSNAAGITCVPPFRFRLTPRALFASVPRAGRVWRASRCALFPTGSNRPILHLCREPALRLVLPPPLPLQPCPWVGAEFQVSLG